MRLLLDECVPKRLRRELPGYDVRTLQEAVWAGVKNGALLRAADGQFDGLLAVDQGVVHHQNFTGLRIGAVIMVASSNDIDDLRPLVPKRSIACSRVKSSEWVAKLAGRVFAKLGSQPAAVR